MTASCGGCYKPLCDKCLRKLKDKGRTCKHCMKISEDKDDDFFNDGLWSRLRVWNDVGLITVELIDKVNKHALNIHLTGSETRRLIQWLKEHVDA